MKFIQYINGVVVDILNIRDDTIKENNALVESISIFESKESHNGILKYNRNGLYWDYEPVEENNEISSKEFQSMVEEIF